MIKKIAYVCRWSMEKTDGVSQKIYNQIAAWKALGIDVQLFCRSPSAKQDMPEKGIYAMQRPFPFWRKYNHVMEAIDNFKPDVIYSRYEIPTSFYMRLLKKYSSRVVVEINTNDLEEMKLLSRLSPLRYFPRRLCNALLRRQIFSKCGCIITHTYELARSNIYTKFNKHIVVAPNSIQLNRHAVVKSDKIESKPYNLLFLGTANQAWQGLDKVQKMAKLLGDNFCVHVGMGGIPPHVDGNIVYHGFLSPDKYKKIAAGCIAGIGTLALYRKNMQEVNAIKTREYIAMGLPIIIGHPDTVFIENKPEWVCEIPNDDDSLNEGNLAVVVQFLNAMRTRVVSHEESAQYIDSAILEKKRIQNITNCLQK